VSSAPVPHAAEPCSAAAEGAGSTIEDEVVGLYRSHSHGLTRYAATICPDWELAEDAIQESFLRYFLARKEGQGIRSPAAWLYRVLRNLLLDERKRVWFRSSTGLEAARDQPDSGQNPEARLEREELSERLLRSLSARELECLRLRMEGLAYQEIAAVLRIRPGTVGALLARALEKTQRIAGVNRRGQ
jgi:RNA polymerase sigma-70 factor (ECF subfamily)